MIDFEEEVRNIIKAIDNKTLSSNQLTTLILDLANEYGNTIDVYKEGFAQIAGCYRGLKHNKVSIQDVYDKFVPDLEIKT